MKKSSKFLLLALIGSSIIIAIIAALDMAGVRYTPEYTKEEHLKTLAAALDNARKSEQKEMTFFLGFTLGMTEDEVSHYLDSLYQSGKLYSYNGAYAYDFTQEQGAVVRVTFATSFHEGGLYKLDCFLEDKLAGNTGYDYLPLLLAFKDVKGEEGFSTYNGEGDESDTLFYSIKDNLVVSFRRVGLSSVMTYEDAPTAAKVKSEKEKEVSERWQKSAAEL